MKYDQVILEKNAYYEILNIKWRYEFIKVHGKQEVLRYGKYTKSSSNRMWVCRSTIAYTLMQKGLFSEMVLLDANKAKAEGEAMDISHGLPFTHAMDIYAGEYEDIADASVVIITAGANQKPGETRLDLVQKNAAIMRSIIKEIKRVNCEGILLIVSNPVDILTEVALRESGFPKERVIGSGTVLDTARLKYIISEKIAEMYMRLS